MFLFPVIYIFSFLNAIANIIKNKKEGILNFFVFGLPFYITSLSVCYMYGFAKAIPFLQAFKEIAVLLVLAQLIYQLKRKVQLQLTDQLVISYFLYTLLYVFLPIGPNSFFEKLISFKSLSFFPLVYFIGRLINAYKINLSKYYHFICLLSIAAALVVLYEIIIGRHLQTQTGYADYMWKFHKQEATGNYGLSWTFETENGLKRLASFFSMPLEHAAATLVTLAILAALVTKNNNHIKFNQFTIITLLCTILSIAFALSRASFVSYFIMLYVYSFLTKRWLWLKIFHYSVIILILLFILFLKGSLYDFIVSTIDFSNSSSLEHILSWLSGIETLVSHPLGLGLGMSGEMGNKLGDTTGGENQFLIIGVQTGIIGMLLYLILYINLIYFAWKHFFNENGKTRRVALTVLLLKVGLIIPLLTSEAELYIYISYTVWFLSGLLVNMVCHKFTSVEKLQAWQKR